MAAGGCRDGVAAIYMVAFFANGPCLAADVSPAGGGYRARLPPVRRLCRAERPSRQAKRASWLARGSAAVNA